MGATPSRLRWILVGAALAPVTAGAALGIPLAYATSGLIASHRFGVEATPLMAYVLGMAIVIAGSGAAMARPMIQAGRVSPSEALRAL